MENVEVKVLKFDVDWLDIKNLCRRTVNMGDSHVDPKEEWKKKLLIAEHSPLRHSLITIEIKNIPYAISTHFVRHHIGVEKYVGTSRTDRTGVDRKERSQMDPVTMRMDLNMQAIVNISRKRLCNQADPTTKAIWLKVLKALVPYCPELVWACVPEGIHQACCPESFSNCKSCVNFLSNLSKEELLDMKSRLDAYNNQRKLLASEEQPTGYDFFTDRFNRRR